MTMKKVVHKTTLDKQGNDFAYWQSQPYELRLAALEQIRQEYHLWKYGFQPRFHRVLTITKQ